MNKNPLVRFVVLLVAGIIIGSLFDIPFVAVLILAGIFLSILLINIYLKVRISDSIKVFSQYVLIVLLGTSYYLYSNRDQITYPFNELSYRNAILHGNVSWLELKREGRMILYIETDSVTTQVGTYKCRKKILCSIYDDRRLIDSLYNVITIGNKIELMGTLRKARDKRNPYEFDYAQYLYNKGISAVFTSYDSKSLKVTSKEISYFDNAVFQIRQNLDERIALLQNKTTSALLRGLLLADRSQIDYEIQDDFVNSGVVHVLSVSGLHVGYIVLIFLIIFSRFNLYLKYILTILGLVFYTILTGADSPVVRSTVMAIILLSAPILQRNYNSLNGLALAAFIILAINPNQLFNPSFQLSFTAMLALVLIYPMFSKEIGKHKIKSKILKYILLFLASTLAAQVGTLPFTLTYFHRFSISSFIANMIVIPLSGLIVGLGIFSLFIGAVFLGIGQIFGAANDLLTYLLYLCIKYLGQGKFAFITINQFSVYDAIIFYLSLAAIILILKISVTLKSKIIFFMLMIITSYSFMRLDNKEMMPKNKLSVMAVDVGQGNAFLIKFPNGESALIDAGNSTQYFDNGQRIILPILSKMDISAIDYGIVSHIDSDHSGGFVSLIKEHKIKKILKPATDSTSIIDINYEDLCKKEHIPVKYFCKEKFAIGNARLYVLNDTIKYLDKLLTSNEKSGIVKLIYGNKSFLFTGDAGVKIEKQYIKQYNKFLKSDVLFVGHHGSRSSSSEEFISVVNPSDAVISCGLFNKFNHPHKETLEKLNSLRVKIFRTDYNGAILFQTDGISLKTINWRKYENGVTL